VGGGTAKGRGKRGNGLCAKGSNTAAIVGVSVDAVFAVVHLVIVVVVLFPLHL